ncbi:MAG: DUF2064 domain-containing protein [Verrucomicrobia bacterium]|nr:MAG: DUF2064 domain-containing protein [Verrucomicrobiota bacterium]
MSDPAHILLFARYPVPGQAKTRLIPSLGPVGAARLHRRMTEHVISAARACARQKQVVVTICFTGADRRDFRAWLGTDLEYAAQSSGDLGQRLRHAFEHAFRRGASRVVVIGADIPAISAEIMTQALNDLQRYDVVLGPATDGGYYLLGMNRYHPDLFSKVTWGTEHVYAQTCAIIQRLKLNRSDLPVLNDIDRPADLSVLRTDPHFTDVWNQQPQLSVIIPMLNEAAVLEQTLESARRSSNVELIAVDGGSRDTSREIATRAGAKLLEVAGGRAAQQNAGAAQAQGRLLLFLHADTLLPNDYADSIRRTLENPAIVAGAFRFQTDGRGLAMRIMEWGTNIRSSIFQWPYGDQGLFMEKRVFEELHGFAAVPIMEDFELVRRLRQRGTIITLPTVARTSARRWQRLGVLQSIIRNQIMIAGFFAGVSPERLAQFYHRPLSLKNSV